MWFVMNWSVFRICFAIFQCAKYIGIWRRSLGNMRTNVRARIGREFRIWPEIWTSFGMSFSQQTVRMWPNLRTYLHEIPCEFVPRLSSNSVKSGGLSRFVAQALFALRWNEGENAPPQLLKGLFFTTGSIEMCPISSLEQFVIILIVWALVALRWGMYGIL